MRLPKHQFDCIQVSFCVRSSEACCGHGYNLCSSLEPFLHAMQGVLRCTIRHAIVFGTLPLQPPHPPPYQNLDSILKPASESRCFTNSWTPISRPGSVPASASRGYRKPLLRLRSYARLLANAGPGYCRNHRGLASPHHRLLLNHSAGAS